MAPDSPGDGWERAFWLTFERSSNGIALVDEQRRFVEVNDALLTILGASRGEIVGASVVDAIPSSERALAQREWDAFLRSGNYSGGGPILRRDGSEVEIEVAARLTHVGGRRLATCVVTSASGPWPTVKVGTGPEQLLTKREQEVVSLIALGYEGPDIAEKLFISCTTVKTHVRNAMQKLGVRTRAQLVATVLSRDNTFRPPQLDE